ncbi:hypothetical protein QUB05_16505 [Microcoleus sp. F10-C6]|uniref:hypothetical protein n=1 Tax=unclassified Microcoleus TaxID=2642155 RepID=UPI002FD34AFF
MAELKKLGLCDRQLIVQTFANTVLDGKTRFLEVIWSYTLEPDNQKPGFLGLVRPGLAKKQFGELI